MKEIADNFTNLCEQNDLAEALRRTVKHLKNFVTFDLAAFAINDKHSGETRIFIDRNGHDSEIEVKKIVLPYVKDFLLLGGNLVAVSYLDEKENVQFMNTIFGQEDQEIASSIIFPVNLPDYGQGALVLGSFTESFINKRTYLKHFNIDGLFTLNLKKITDPKTKSPNHSKSTQEDLSAYYKTLFDNLGAAAVIFQTDGSIKLVNQLFSQWIGLPPNLLENKKNLFDFIAEAEYPKMHRSLINFYELSKSHPNTIECVLINNRGEEKIAEASWSRLPNSEERLVTFKDITLYKLDTIELREKDKIHSLIEGISSVVYSNLEFSKLFSTIYKQIRKIIDSNVISLALTNNNVIEMRAKYWDSKVDLCKNEIASVEEYIHYFPIYGKPKAYLYDYESLPLVYKLLGKEIKSYCIIPLILKKRLIGSLNIGSIYPEAFSKDHTEILKRMGTHTANAIVNTSLYVEIKETKEYLESLLESSVDAIITTNKLGKIILFSKGAEKILGYSADEVIGKKINKLFLEGKRTCDSVMSYLRLTGKLQDFENQFLSKTGKTIPVRLSVSPLQDKHGLLTGIIVIARDMTESKKAEAEIQRKTEELENLFYLISHNLKSPIVSIQGFASLLKGEHGTVNKEESLYYIDRIQMNAVRMERMIHDILEFSKVGQRQKTIKKVSIQRIVSKVCSDFQFRIENRNIRLEIASDLPTVLANREDL
ncbi:MAG: PAS domain S-box protein, partial [bacterium]